MSDYGSYLQQALNGPVRAVEGGSGFFSPPSNTLDPHLFDSGERMRPEVREWILQALYRALQKVFIRANQYTNVWVAGSGISYQWAADRSNGDLDVLFSFDFPEFFRINSGMRGLSETEIADYINNRLKEELWPETAHTNLNGQVYEVTYYLNPNSSDIRDIHPYAAYSLTDDEWTVRPPVLPSDPETLYPADWSKHVQAERSLANEIINRYNGLSRTAQVSPQGSPAWHNTMRSLGATVAQAKALFDDIHLGRKKAFGPDGAGYGDFYNYRWQSHKRFGTVAALNTIAQSQHDARVQWETEEYGQPIEDAEHALIHAALWRADR